MLKMIVATLSAQMADRRRYQATIAELERINSDEFAALFPGLVARPRGRMFGRRR